MHRFTRLIIVLATLLHATLGCHAHHGQACDHGPCQHDDVVDLAANGTETDCQHHHAEDRGERAGCRCDAGEPCAPGQAPGEPCSDCEGGGCHWWKGPASPPTPELMGDLLAGVWPCDTPGLSRPPATERMATCWRISSGPPLRRHLYLQILLI
ncbi:hypothetical protein [Lignipirellula cremea]|uniref:Uncharacterized protein n=1 Tax=Lignipirellula cremea TaxID=2528010 RepID=A0A518E3L7_9BACT|nr:hypothetical protein [Lignipirellula cremea]QDU98690.1 hypothetical protein Pla8534_65630 [Lignipirellula cremea]